MRSPKRHTARQRVFIGTFAALLMLSRIAGAATPLRLVVTTLLQNGKPLPGAVVTAYPLTHPSHPSTPVHAVVDQINKTFVPDVIVIPVGSTLEFPNTDSVSHEVYSFSPAHSFQLPLYRGKPYPPEHLDRAGIVTLGCNIHDSMIAYVVVTEAPHFGLTDARGQWTVGDVAAGRYRIEVWHPRLASPANLQKEVVVAADMDITVQLNKPLRDKPLSEQPHSWDAY